LIDAFSLEADAANRTRDLENRQTRKADAMLVERILPIAAKRLSTMQVDADLADAARLLCETHISLVVVCNPDGTMVGVITKTDIVRQIAHGQGGHGTTPVAAVMTREVTHCHPSDSLHDVLSKMKDQGLVHVPIVDQDSTPTGVINARDALQVLLGEVEYDVSFLRDYVGGLGYR
jgi:signal-transduction protein with cAMP-binding, CBS, and nucleotidyltransferase domain